MKKILALSTLILSLLSVSIQGASAQTLSKNDQLFREDIQYRLPAKTLTQINNVIANYKVKIAKMNKVQADALTDSILKKVERILYIMSAAESNNKQLAKQPSNLYRAYTLIKFELMLLK